VCYEQLADVMNLNAPLTEFPQLTLHENKSGRNGRDDRFF